MMNQTLRLTKLALIRDTETPIGQPGKMHLNCPCGTKIDVKYDDVTCSNCGQGYTSMGWVK